MKISDDIESDDNNNNSTETRPKRRGRPRKSQTEVLRKSEEKTIGSEKIIEKQLNNNGGDDRISDGLSPSPKGSATPKLRTPASIKKRDLINLQSTLSPKYIGHNTSPVLSDSERSGVRATRNRNNFLNASAEILTTDDENCSTLSATVIVDTTAVEKMFMFNETGSSVYESNEENSALKNQQGLKRKLIYERKHKTKSKTQMHVHDKIGDSQIQNLNDSLNETKVIESELAMETARQGKSQINEKLSATEKTQDVFAPEADTEPSETLPENVHTVNLRNEQVGLKNEVANSDEDIIQSQNDMEKDEFERKLDLKAESKDASKRRKIDELQNEEEKVVGDEPSELQQKIESKLLENSGHTNTDKSQSLDNEKEDQICDINESNNSKINSLEDANPISIEKHTTKTALSTLQSEMTPDTETSLQSPSSISLDSAKGSSIATDGNWPTYQTGDLFWGQLYTYCYWPCMVCADPEGKLVNNSAPASRKPVEQTTQVPVQVHVRFFADNGRRNWIKQENLLPFTGLADFEARREKIQHKYGIKSVKFRQMIPKKTKLKIWHDAITEANMVAVINYNERLEKFFEIYENSVTFQKHTKRKRRSSMLHEAGSTSDIGSSIYDSTDKLDGLKQMVLVPKRERSESPFSPAFSPVKGTANFVVKRRKLSNNDANAVASKSVNKHKPEDDVDLSEVSAFIGQQESNPYRSKEFMELFLVLKDYVVGREKDDQMERCLLSIANNIWSLRLLGKRQKKESQPDQKISEGGLDVSGIASVDGSFKRLSSRLKNISIRRSQTPVTLPVVSETTLKAPERRTSDSIKPKKQINRPIDEVVADILNLDKKYLFRGLSRDPVCKYCLQPDVNNLRRCSNGCNAWLHVNCPSKENGNKEQHKQQSNTVGKSSESDTGISAETSSDEASPTPTPTSLQIEERTQVSSPTSDITTNVSPEVDSIEPLVCNECATNAPETCCICHQVELSLVTPPTSPLKSPLKQGYESNKLVGCNMPICNKKFHPACCKYWPQAKISKTSVRCPSHVCHTCVSDDPSGMFQQLGNAKLTKCVKCPASYHMDSTCIPAGSQILTAAHIICPRHSKTKTDANVNVGWCYICVKGGELICCETCPIAVHAHCRNIPIKPNEGYICEECESGRLPLYGEIVWAKFNNFRWWPAIILPPTEVPHNIARLSHGSLDFAVRFFGTHDHGWISRRRVYLYIEGDAGEAPRSKSQLDQNYTNGVEEASRYLRIVKARRQELSIATFGNGKLHPQPYVKIKTNKSVPPVKLHIDLEKVNKCECNPDAEDPCGPYSECLNRVLFNECNPKFCRAGARCQNQMFELRISPRLEVVYMQERGFGLVCREPISEGTFIIEYVGEVINDAEFRLRMTQKTRDRDENFYFLVVEKDYVIDAGPKGNLARFMNHSCEPNCETQKWLVNGINRIGLFAIRDIPENTELTFNYHWDDLLNKQKKVCFCGASKCAGEIGGKYKEDHLKEIVPQINKTKSNKSNTVVKNKKFKELKRLQKKKHNLLKINIINKKPTTKSAESKATNKARKHVSADDVIEIKDQN